MTAWLRREDVPVQPLAEERMRLVHTYMDADEEAARLQAIEERERQTQAHVRLRAVPNENRARPDADSAGKVQGEAAGESEPRADDFADAVLREAAKHAARQVAAVEEMGQRRAAEEVARQVAAAEEHARRAAEEEVQLRVAAAVEEARKEISREAAEETARQVAAAEERARRLAVEAAARLVETVALGPSAQGQSEAAVEDVHDESGVSGRGERFHDPAEKALEEAPPAASDHAPDDSAEGLPVYEWLHAATPSDDGSDALDWTRDLLRTRDKTRTDLD